MALLRGRIVHAWTGVSVPGRLRGGERFIRAAQVARMLGVSTKWVYQAAREGTVPSYRFGGVVRFRRSEILAWIEARARKSDDG
jgi:excisionase family DNA binding protein